MKMRVIRWVWGPVAVIAGLGIMLSVWGDWAPEPVTAQPPEVPHYKCYHIMGGSPGISVSLETQFGLHPDVVVGPATSLCLPAIKNGEGSLLEPHLKCYEIAQKSSRTRVSLESQFGLERNVTLGDATKLCVPANKAIFPAQPEPVVPTAPHYECYDILSGGSDPAPTASVKDQFYATPQAAPVGPATRLCLPALKNGKGDLSVPHIECYQISGPLPGKVVNLLTQFGPEVEVPVEPPQELCVPVIKEFGVGGVQQLPDVAEPAGATTSAEGRSSATYAAIAGIAAGAVVLAAGGWYARRRWLR